MPFTHLHVHSSYSLLDSTCRLEDLVQAAVEMGLPALALTDRNALYGAIPFYSLCQEKGLHPILGLEATMRDGHTLVLLAENETGYRNLCRLSTVLQSFSPYPPRLPWTALRHHSRGLVALTGGNTGWITALVRQGDRGRAQRVLGGLLGLFGRRNVFLELQIHAPEDIAVVEQLVALAEEAGLAYLATNDVHFLRPQDAPAHLLLASIRTATHLTQSHPDKPAWPGNRPPPLHLRSPQEMAELFARWPRALRNTLYLAERCQVELQVGTPIFPRLALPARETAFSRLWKLAFRGAVERYRPLTPAVLDRLHYELDMIEELGYSTYFLVVADIAAEARQRGIPVLGRGSAASSLVAYTLGITPVDPIAHQLTFERFLHPERPDPPDIDLDFCWRRRDEIIDYVYRAYCDSHVAMIGTHNTFHTRSAVRETVKVFGLPPRAADRILADCWAGLLRGDGRDPAETDPSWFDPPDPPAGHVAETIVRAAASIAGLPHHLSIHCGGVVVSPGPITDLVPLQRSAKGLLVTQYDMHAVERLGLVKMDLLGVRALTTVADAVEVVRQAGANPLTVEAIPLGDGPTYDLLARGETIGCFQLESPGVRALLRRYQPHTLDDVMAVISLFRPAPLRGGLKETFLRRRNGLEPVVYLLDGLASAMRERVGDILGETYGVILYQEQVLRLLSEVGGLPLGQAEALRRALPKVQGEAKQRALRERFAAGALERGLTKKQAGQVWDLLAGFTGYAFCKAHAASYAIVAYRAAYLKANYPAEFLAAAIENEGGYYAPAAYAEEARRRGLRLLPPHVNTPSLATRGSGDTVRIGLRRVRGLRARTVKRLLEEARLSPFTTLRGLIARVRPGEEEAKALIRIGACDGLGGNRAEMVWELYTHLPLVWDQAAQGQLPLGLVDVPETMDVPALPDFTLEERIRLEREILGLAVSGHPLSIYGERLDRYRPVSSAVLDTYIGERVIVAGWPIGARPHRTKQGEWMAFLSLEDRVGTIEVVLFPQVYRACAGVVGQEGPHVVRGLVQERQGEVVIVGEAVWIEE
jgi:DNA-directed DNA polymerase III PolC